MATPLSGILDLSYALYEAHYQLLLSKKMAELVHNEYDASLQTVETYDEILQSEKNAEEMQNKKLETLRSAQNRLEILSKTVSDTWNQRHEQFVRERELQLNIASENPASNTNHKLTQITNLRQQGNYHQDIEKHFALLIYIEKTVSELRFSQDELDTYTAEQITGLDYYLADLIKEFKRFEQSMIRMDDAIRKQYPPKQLTIEQKEKYDRARWIVDNKDATTAEWENTKSTLQTERNSNQSKLIDALEEALIEKGDPVQQAKASARAIASKIIFRAEKDIGCKQSKVGFNRDMLYSDLTGNVMRSCFSKEYPFERNDDFYKTLESKANYYWQRSEFFKDKQDSQTKQKLYFQLFVVFSREMMEYKLQENITPSDCLHSLSQEVTKLETNLEINEGRSIIAKALRWLKNLLGMIDQKELTKSVRVSEIPQSFYDNPSTKTMEDLSQAKNLGQNSVK